VAFLRRERGIGYFKSNLLTHLVSPSFFSLKSKHMDNTMVFTCVIYLKSSSNIIMDA